MTVYETRNPLRRRPPWGAFALLLWLCLGCIAAARPEADPTTVARSYWTAMGKGEFDAAYKLLSKEWQKDVTKSMFATFARTHSSYQRPADRFGPATLRKTRALVPFKLVTRACHACLVKEAGGWRLANIDAEMPASWIENPLADQVAATAAVNAYSVSRFARNYAEAYKWLSPATRQAMSLRDYESRAGLPPGAGGYMKQLCAPFVQGQTAQVFGFTIAWAKKGGPRMLVFGMAPLEKVGGKWWVSIPPRHSPAGGG